MKMAPIYRELTKIERFKTLILHTGQHYDYDMSRVFFEDLDVPDPDFYLDVRGGTQSAQTSLIMKRSEEVLMQVLPDLVVVFGDVNSTLGVSIVAKKLKLTLAHVESGLRSFDRTMPEEINRIVTDTISDILFTTEKDANDNLIREGHTSDQIFFVGNTMIDSLIYILEKNRKRENPPIHSNYAVLTLHRPSNVDNKEKLRSIMEAVLTGTDGLEIIFPIHPRTYSNMEKFGLSALMQRIKTIPPQSYKNFIDLIKDAAIVITDSGGIQEETTFLGAKCVTVRENTERPITIKIGTNTLAGTDRGGIVNSIKQALLAKKQHAIPPLWDGKASVRIRQIIENLKL